MPKEKVPTTQHINVLVFGAAAHVDCRPFFLLSAVSQPIDESQVNLSFQDWLAGVTERINQTMHYQFDGEQYAFINSITKSKVLAL